MKPRLTARVVRGLDEVWALAHADFQADQAEETSRWSKAGAQEVADALDFVVQLCRWHRAKTPQ